MLVGTGMAAAFLVVFLVNSIRDSWTARCPAVDSLDGTIGLALQAISDERCGFTTSLSTGQATISCPDCGGPTWLVGEAGTRRYRCYLGHVTSARELIDDSDVQVESALWSAVRALHDRATTLETLASDAARAGNMQTSQTYAERAKETREQAEVARRFMLDLARPR